MNNLQIFNKDIIPVYTTDEGNKVVMGRELHEKLGIKDKYTDWMQRMIGAGFIEGSDYFTLREKPKRKDGTEMPGERINHIMTLDMAKHIAMIQRTPQGMAIRQKLIELEKSFSVPQIQVGNSLQALNLLVQCPQNQAAVLLLYCPQAGFFHSCDSFQTPLSSLISDYEISTVYRITRCLGYINTFFGFRNNLAS